jgi:hypothetical protein
MRTNPLKSLSLGGICAAGNCTAWVVLFLVGPLGVIHWRLQAVVEILLSLPFLIVLSFGHRVVVTVWDVVAYWICIALNSFAWGYSVAWLLRHIPHRTNRDSKETTAPS